MVPEARRRLGEHVKSLVEGLLEVNALYRLRQAQGVVRLADKHGAERLDAACRRAIEIGDPEYRTVKGILVAGTENDGAARAVAARRAGAPARPGGPVRRPRRRRSDLEGLLQKPPGREPQ